MRSVILLSPCDFVVSRASESTRSRHASFTSLVLCQFHRCQFETECPGVLPDQAPLSSSSLVNGSSCGRGSEITDFCRTRSLPCTAPAPSCRYLPHSHSSW